MNIFIKTTWFAGYKAFAVGSLVLIFGLMISVFACSSANKKIHVQGKVYLTGNDPFTHLVLENEQGTYVLVGNKTTLLKKEQNKTIKLQGIVQKKTSPLPNAKLVIKVQKFEVISP